MTAFDGVLALNKPEGMTSHDAVNRIRRLYNTKAVGHTGTLDPMATGVMVILIGRATKASEYIVSDRKEYTATLRFGLTTDTGDITGRMLQTFEKIPTKEEFLSALPHFLGAQKQIPPMYSAIKINGKKLVDLARQGIEVEREARDIVIFSLDGDTDENGDFSVNVVCSKGTYIRTLCEDIGSYLGSGATMTSLRRNSSGRFNLSDCVTLEELEKMSIDERYSLLSPLENIFCDYPKITLSDFFARLAHSGAEIYQKKIKTDYKSGSKVLLYDNCGLFAMGEVREFEEGSAIKPIKQF